MSTKDVRDGWLNHLLIKVLKWKKPTPELQEYIDHRFETCKACPYLATKSYPGIKREWYSCDKCGCAFPPMIFAYNKRCPDRRWDVVPVQVRENN